MRGPACAFARIPHLAGVCVCVRACAQSGSGKISRARVHAEHMMVSRLISNYIHNHHAHNSLCQAPISAASRRGLRAGGQGVARFGADECVALLRVVVFVSVCVRVMGSQLTSLTTPAPTPPQPSECRPVCNDMFNRPSPFRARAREGLIWRLKSQPNRDVVGP